MEEQLIKAMVTAHIVTARDENGAIIDAVPGQIVMVNENSLEAMKDRLKRWEAPAAFASAPKKPDDKK